MGSTVDENALARQYEEKLIISRTSTPVERGALERQAQAPRGRGHAGGAHRDVLAGEQHEHVLQVGRAAHAIGRVTVVARSSP